MMRLLVLLALVGAAVALPKKIQRIVGGEATSIEQYPYMSNMQYGLFGIWWFQACGGSLVSNFWVLSAAHCYDGDTPSVWQVRLGSTFASSGGSMHAVQQLVMHENYDTPVLDNDVALVRLGTPAIYSNVVQAVRIPGAGYNIPDNSVVYSIGWGTTTQGGSSAEVLRHVDVRLINQETCAERYAHLQSLPGFQNWPLITDGMLCAGILDVGGKDACQGDSGGPLAYKDHDGHIVVGVTSWGNGCAHAEYPGVNARVSHYTNWIVANAN